MLSDVGNCTMMPDNQSSIQYFNHLSCLSHILSPLCVAYILWGGGNWCFQIAIQKTRRRSKPYKVLTGWGRADFSKNLRASLFNKYLSNEPNFSWIHLAGQYL
jgi:hypothetical protein